MTADATADVLLVLSRLVWYAGVVGVIGAAAFRLFAPTSAGVPPSGADNRRATVGLAAAAVLIAGVFARLYAQAYASFGIEEPVTADLLLEVAIGLPPWSTGWMLQLAAAVFSLAAFGLARTARLVWTTAAAAGVAVSAPLTGHAVAQPSWYVLPIGLQAAHVLGAGVWIGGLFVLVTVGLTRTARQAPADSPATAVLVNAFSPFALGGAGLLAVSGVLSAGLYLTAPADLWTTSYGRTLLLKVAAFGGVAVMGLINWQRVRPRLARGTAGAQLLRRTAAIELALAAVVLVLTAMLVGLPQPGD